MRRFMLSAAVCAIPILANAQQPAAPPPAAMPAGWMVRADEPPKPDLSKLSFAPMSKGWHITTGHAENVFKVEARKDSLRFLINGVVVASRPRSELAADGVVGFRINHGLSVHVAALTVEKAK